MDYSIRDKRTNHEAPTTPHIYAVQDKKKNCFPDFITRLVNKKNKLVKFIAIFTNKLILVSLHIKYGPTF